MSATPRIVWADLGYEAEFTLLEASVSFRLSSHPDGEYYVKGFVRFDGCINWHDDGAGSAGSPGMLHACGRVGVERFGAARPRA